MEFTKLKKNIRRKMSRYSLERDLQCMMIDQIPFNEKLVIGSLMEILKSLDHIEEKLKELETKKDGNRE
jgi:hypothetical protein